MASPSSSISTSTSTSTSTATSTSPATPACLFDEIGASFTCASVVRMVAFLWTLPASLVLVAGVRIIFDRPPSPVATAFVDLSRAAAVPLAAFTLLIGGIWLVRSGRVLPPLCNLDETWMNAAGHLRFASLAGVALVGAAATEPSGVSLVLASVAAIAGFIAGLILPRWIIRVATADRAGAAVLTAWRRDRAVVCATALAVLIVFEVTVGWWHSMVIVDGASVLSGVVAIIRGVALTAAVVAMVVGSRR